MSKKTLFKLTISPSDNIVLESQITAISPYGFDTVIKCEDGKLKIIISDVEVYSLSGIIRDIHNNIKLDMCKNPIIIEYYEVEYEAENEVEVKY